MVDLAGEARDRSDVHPRRAVGHHEHAEAAAPARFLAGPCEHQPVGGDARVARPDLVTTDHVLVAVAPRLRLQAEQVGAGAGLAVALPERAVAARHRRQYLAPQALAAVGDDGVRGLPAAGERPERRAGQGQLFQQHELEEQRALLAAEGLGPAHAEPAPRAEGAHERARVRAGAVARVHALERKTLERLRAEKAPHLFREGALVGGEGEVHRESGL